MGQADDQAVGFDRLHDQTSSRATIGGRSLIISNGMGANQVGVDPAGGIIAPSDSIVVREPLHVAGPEKVLEASVGSDAPPTTAAADAATVVALLGLGGNGFVEAITVSPTAGPQTLGRVGGSP